jgi:hypothetical protein
VEVEGARRLALAFAVPSLDERRCHQGKLASVGGRYGVEGFVDVVGAVGPTRVGERDDEGAGVVEDVLRDARSDGIRSLNPVGT